MFYLDGKPLGVDSPFTHNDIQYPANWLRLASLEDKEAIGITEVPDPVRADDRFYWNGDASNPKDLDQIKSMLISQVKATAGSLLSQSDWKIVRASEGIKPVDQKTLDYRSVIREKSDGYEDTINAASSVDQLATLQFDWTVDEEA